MKKQKGITLVSLIITIVLLLIITGTTVYTSVNRFKINNLKKTYLGKDVCDFIIVNSIDKLHSYLPCVAWGKQAKEIAKLPIGTKISIEGELRSREYKKYTDEVNFDIKIAHEINVKSFNCEKHIEI